MLPVASPFSHLPDMNALRPCVGAILAGGQARRMGGEPKGLLHVGQSRIIDRVHAALAATCSRVILLANAPEADRWLPDIEVVRDRQPGAGPLAGLDAALRAAAGDDVLLVAWDMPFVTAPVLETITRSGRGFDAVVPSVPSAGGLQPTCAWYAAAVAPVVEAHLGRGHRAMRELLAAVRVAIIGEAALRELGEPADLFMNVNDPAELERATRLADSSSTIASP